MYSFFRTARIAEAAQPEVPLRGARFPQPPRMRSEYVAARQYAGHRMRRTFADHDEQAHTPVHHVIRRFAQRVMFMHDRRGFAQQAFDERSVIGR